MPKPGEWVAVCSIKREKKSFGGRSRTVCKVPGSRSPSCVVRFSPFPLYCSFPCPPHRNWLKGPLGEDHDGPLSHLNPQHSGPWGSSDCEYVLLSYGCCDKLPQTLVASKQPTFILRVLEIRNWKPSCQHTVFLRKDSNTLRYSRKTYHTKASRNTYLTSTWY